MALSNSADLAGRLQGTRGLLKRGLRQRVLGILDGRGEDEDFRSLFLELRFRTKGRAHFREIGDFIAHRDLRDRGPVAQLVRDVFTGGHVFTLLAVGQVPPVAEVRSAARANLRLVTDESIASTCAMSRVAAVAAVERACDLLERGLHPATRDAFVLNVYGNLLKWHPAFTDADLLQEWIAVLEDNDLLAPDERQAMQSAGEGLTLWTLSVLHGSEIQLPDKSSVSLQAGFFNKERRLEVKAHLSFAGLGKPTFMPFCIFLSALQPEGRCEDRLVNSEIYGWNMPIRLKGGQLVIDGESGEA